jgi:hypothetical protein
MKPTRILGVITAVAALTACETETRHTLSPDFGNAVRHNMAVHIINPEGTPGPIEPSGLQGPRAAKPYRDLLTRKAGDSQYRAVTPAPAAASGVRK